MTMPIVLTEAQWANSQLSVARYFGGCKFNGVQYVILNKEGKDIFECTHEANLAGRDKAIELNRPSFIGGDKITFSVKIRSKRKWRKMLYPFLRPIPMNRQYISKREMIHAIHKMSEEAKVGHIMDSDEQLMHYSSKHLYAIFMHLYDKLKGGAYHA